MFVDTTPPARWYLGKRRKEKEERKEGRIRMEDVHW
jgi:hypothetical protein